ncbi:MAG TPA: RNA polymerase-binding protein DksA [Rubrivivax sp.]|nr:RNA polymerase-binding protein DksA [Rubrivivax sp.]
MSKLPVKAATATKAPAKAAEKTGAPAKSALAGSTPAVTPATPGKGTSTSAPPDASLPPDASSKGVPTAAATFTTPSGPAAAVKSPAVKASAKAAASPPAVSPRPAVKTASSIKDSAKTAANTLPTQAPMPQTNRFTDRFAPARAPMKPMTEAADMPRAAHKADPKLANAWKNKPGRDLTEDELLAMPDGEYMNDKQLDFFRARLQQQKDDLLSNAGETTEHLREDTSIVPDPADRATIEEEHALELRTRDRERKLLKKIAQSLGRLDSGDYGYCDETGEPIGLQRLLARPTATLSLEAQQRCELKQKMFGD